LLAASSSACFPRRRISFSISLSDIEPPRGRRHAITLSNYRRSTMQQNESFVKVVRENRSRLSPPLTRQSTDLCFSASMKLCTITFAPSAEHNTKITPEQVTNAALAENPSI
jgi:hypothetical protein